ncbi:MAG: polyphosphate polymerase domain-containing protein [Verrucomicrobia subdivision 3 bacterium]|nr:polyphosphate polymerase domain-containing protein [Limisphaerales bacterium]
MAASVESDLPQTPVVCLAFGEFMSDTRLQRQRFEKKYRISEDLALAVRPFIRSYLELDEHGGTGPNGSYPVHSLYFDSDQLATYWMTVNGAKNRFKLRLRFYNDQPDSPVFFEIKRRINKCILKRRGAVRKAGVPWILAGHLPTDDEMFFHEPEQLGAVMSFCELMQDLGARPKLHVTYLREAWIHPAHDRVRVTFDRDVRGERDTTTRFSTLTSHPVRPFGDEVILELKYTDRCPDWLREMVERFELIQCSAAKYCECIDALADRGDRFNASTHQLFNASPF